MNNGSARLGTVAGVAVNAHWSVGLVAILLGASLVPAIGLLPSLVAIVAFLASIVAHELAHALVARRFCVGTDSIQIWALGGVARLDREAPTAKAEGWIAAAGPIASAVIGAAALAVWWALHANEVAHPVAAVLGWLGLINALVALFNLLPGAPLDGGRILKAVRWGLHGDRHRATREAARSGWVIGWAIVAVGVVAIARAQTGIWLVITGLFVAMNARAELAGADIASRLAGIKVRDLTWFGVAHAGADMDADSMLWQRQRLGAAGGVAVTDDAGRPQGLVLEQDLWSIPADERPWVMLTEMMVPFDRTARAAPDEDLAVVLPRISLGRPVVTVWEADQLVGMVPPRRLRDQRRAAGL